MNSQPNRTEHAPEPTALRSEIERRGIIGSIPATADQGRKLSSQSNDQRADLHSLNSMIAIPMEIGRFLPLAVAITAAVKEVHQGGLIHKDIKPDNILVSETGDVQLTGFDIASRLPRERQLPAPPEFIAGTLAYMAPEQTGRMNRSIDARSDLYALGVNALRSDYGQSALHCVGANGVGALPYRTTSCAAPRAVPERAGSGLGNYYEAACQDS